MRRLGLAFLMGALLLGGYVAASADRAASWSDGIAGSSGAVPIHLRKCAEGFQYCKVKPSGCGGCHGDWDAMQYQRETGPGEPVNVPVIDRISAEIWLNGREDNWEYQPGTNYVLDLYIKPWGREPQRDPGTYSKVGFNLNASGGSFSILQTDPTFRDTVRITGGNYSHSGSRNPYAQVCNDQACSSRRPYGQTIDDESDWAGELTNTGKGSNITPEAIPGSNEMAYHYRAAWKAPPRQEPNGVAFVMAFMIPNGDGIDSCTYVIDSTGCNSTKGYSDQSNWDWWSFLVPRKIVCEKGQERARCNERVLAFIIPPPPPPDTGGPGDGNGDGGNVPGIGPGAWVILFCVALVRWHAHRRRAQR